MYTQDNLIINKTMSTFNTKTSYFITILILVLFIFFSAYICNYYFKVNITLKLLSKDSPHSYYTKFGPTVPVTCPLKNTNNLCSSTLLPVMGGLDLVQYFIDFKIIGSGEYDESKIGTIGNPVYQAIYNSYIFYFISNKNKEIFLKSPDKYIPQYGGFCAWAIAGEYNYPWSSDCLGPSGNWSVWTIINDKIYFFKDSTPKSFFLQDVSYSIKSGDNRWNKWFGNQSESYYDTNCSISHQY